MAFVVGPLITEVSFTHYYGDFRLWAYVPFSTFAYPDMTLPGVFVNAPSESEVNISLWTLRYEMMAYLAMAVLAGIGLLSYRLLWVLGLVGGLGYFVITYLTPLRAEIPFVDHGLRFGFAFLMGVLLFRYRAVIPLKIWGVALVIGLAVLTNSTSYMEPFRIIALTYTALWFATGVHPWLSSYNRMGDFSYGVFVFHWPIAQLVLHFNPTISYPELLINVLPLAFLMAVISWYGIERPLLSSKDSLAWRLRYIGRELRAFGRLAIEVMTVYPDEEQRDLRQPHPKRALDEPAVRHEGPVSEVGLPPRPYPARVVTPRNGRPH
jgi:peptidoglycan/LPS O-acetylase OafA/YrhL